MTLAPDIFREIDRLARHRGWSQGELARQLGVDRTLLAHLRAGRRVPTTRFLARTARAFAEETSLRDSLWHYLRHELPVGAEEPVIPVEASDAPSLPDDAEQALRAYVRTFPHRMIDGRGLVIRSDSAPLLSAASYLVAESLRRSGVLVAQRAAHLAILPSEAAALRRVRLVVVERVEYASAAVRDILAERLNLGMPVVVTTATDLAGRLESDLERVLRSRCSEVSIAPPPADG